MSAALLAIVRCGCGGALRRGTEQTARGLRWVFTCRWCGVRWAHRDGIFGPLEREPTPPPNGEAGGAPPAESELLAWFRRLPPELRDEVVTHVRSLALSAADAR
jgi:hypothetical protein